MADFTLEGAHKYWRNYEDSMIYRVVTFMETMEHWTLDGNPELEEAMIAMGQALENLENFEVDQQEAFINCGAYLKSSRALHMLQSIDAIEPGAASKMLMYTEEHAQGTDNAAGLFLRRNIVFERLRLLPRVFAPERIQLVLKALENEEDL